MKAFKLSPILGLLCIILFAAPSTGDEIYRAKIEDLVVIGEAELVTIKPQGLVMPARIDSGATTSSIGMYEPAFFERDGAKWITFKIKDRTTNTFTTLDRKVTRMVEIKRHGAEPTIRPVVELEMSLGPKTLKREFSLADRSKFEFPVLIGRNVLRGNFLINVEQKYSFSDTGEQE